MRQREQQGLRSELVETADLPPRDIEAMFRLMEQYFDGLLRETFEADLAEKRWSIMLRDSVDGAIRGFSTITLMEAQAGGEAVRAFYSGDTIIDRACWHPFSLERVWAPLVFSHILAAPETRWYWFMVCKGFRTYRYFPVHFHSFSPSPDAPAPPEEKEVLDALALQRFGRHYDPASCVVSFPRDYRLKPGVGDIAPEKSKNRYVRFFDEANPGWAGGAELACITRLTLENMKPALKKFLPAPGEPSA